MPCGFREGTDYSHSGEPDQRRTRRVQAGDGAELRIDRCLIDANWGQATDVVYQFCGQSRFAGVLPRHGLIRADVKGRQDISTKCPAGIVLDILRTSCYACSRA
ncbi:MAG TPA: hypothetical protein VMW24_23950 [Sedimentisphaerales bacterium]|nr:hypothetical protein [Sedimentisphaerales bacterium]